MAQPAYEWDVETVAAVDSEDYAEGDVVEHHHTASFAEAKQFAATEPDEGMEHRIVLVRDDDECRSWAYLKDDGTLPGAFEDAYSRRVAKVPTRFHFEVARA